MLARVHSHRVLIIGGGAAGFFAAIACAEASPDAEVVVLEKSPQFLTKVRISGGGRCNVTQACFDPRELSASYPRGAQALIGAFQRFQPADTVAWFEERGVPLKREADGRMFPTTDTSQTIVDCLTDAARGAGVQLQANREVEKISRLPSGGFEVTMAHHGPVQADRVLLATGGCRVEAMARLATGLGHTLVAPVPSLFGLRTDVPWVRALPGVSMEDVDVSIDGTSLRSRGPLLFTHTGLSGPSILRLSAWGARELSQRNYAFTLLVNWLPQRPPDALFAELSTRRETGNARLVSNLPVSPLPARLWEKLVQAAGVDPATRWSALSRPTQHRLQEQLIRCPLAINGKSLNKDEFVTCGGIPLREVHFKTMESRICPHLHLAGELLDLDGFTGGFNFQAAWTTGWIAGQAMAQPAKEARP